MPINRTLLERLRNPDPEGERFARASSREVIDSILRNLQSILNTSHGNCLTDQRYGLPHISVIRSRMPFSIAGFEAAIRYSLERYEPRLKNLRVRHMPTRDDGLELRFEISGVIQDDEDRTSVRFVTFADTEGRLRVQ